jgi:hypothetical protein
MRVGEYNANRPGEAKAMNWIIAGQKALGSLGRREQFERLSPVSMKHDKQ